MSLRSWWARVTLRTRAVPPRPAVTMFAGGVLARPAAMQRVIPIACYLPNGTPVMGWRVWAHNDGERVEVLLAWRGTYRRIPV